jgi:DNA-binding NarL/FixJ family response regulator
MTDPQERDGASCSPQVRVLIALRDTLVSDAFGHMLGDAGFLVTASATETLVERLASARPDVVLVGSDVIADPQTLTSLRAHAPAVRVVVMLRDGDEVCVRALVQHAVNAVIPMATRTREAIAILRQVLDGNVVYPSAALDHLGDVATPELLSERQREVLQQVALGHSNEEIARALFISRNTVKFHLREIYARLGVRNRVEAARAAQRALAGSGPGALTARRARPD